MMVDYYLRFDDETAFVEAIDGLDTSMGALDDIGTLYNQDTGTASAGYHVNLRLPDSVALPPALSGYVIAVPLVPKRVFMPA